MVQFQYPSGGDRLASVFQILQNYGFQDFLLPFLLFFALMFAILQKTGLFQNASGKTDRKINGVISGAIAGLIVVPHVLRLYPQNMDPVELMYQFLPMSTVAFVVLLAALLFIGLVVPGSMAKPNLITGIIGIIAAGIVLISFLRNIVPGLIPTWVVIDPTVQALAIVIGVMLLVIWFIAGEESSDDFVTGFGRIMGISGEGEAPKASGGGGGGGGGGAPKPEGGKPK